MRILKAGRDTVIYIKESSHNAINWFTNRNITDQKETAWKSQSNEKQGSKNKTTLSARLSFKIEVEMKIFPEKNNTSVQEMLKGLL